MTRKEATRISLMAGSKFYVDTIVVDAANATRTTTAAQYAAAKTLIDGYAVAAADLAVTLGKGADTLNNFSDVTVAMLKVKEEATVRGAQAVTDGCTVSVRIDKMLDNGTVLDPANAGTTGLTATEDSYVFTVTITKDGYSVAHQITVVVGA